jgi:hypothetical protein
VSGEREYVNPARPTACDHLGVTEHLDDPTGTQDDRERDELVLEGVDDVDGTGTGTDVLTEELTDETEEYLESDDVDLDDGQLAYECAAWAGESRGLLESLLNSQGIPHAWQGTTVTVRDEDEERVDDLIDGVLASARPALDPRAPKLVYEIGVWPVALQTELVDQLTAADVPYEWDEHGDLVVRESDEAEVEAVLELLPDPDDSGLSSDDGVGVHAVLDGLFMSAGRLAKHATDPSATVALVDVTAQLEQMALPFGFEPAQWRRLVESAQQVRDAIEPSSTGDEPATDEEIAERAAVARDLVRQYI